MMNATLICDMQFGSTGKGLIAGVLAELEAPDTVMAAWSMNAGHTYVNAVGRKFVHCMVPNGIVSPNIKKIMIGPGSQIGLDKLVEELNSCSDIIASNRNLEVIIHENACVIQPRHIQEENATMTGIGSTKKGCGAALIEKIRRSADVFSEIVVGQKIKEVNNLRKLGYPIRVVDTDQWYRAIKASRKIQIEGAQGYSLGMNAGFYPYVTSRECTPAQIASDLLFPIREIGDVVGTMRTYPIRVANRFNTEGHMIGWSGPCYDDQEETTFEELGQESEFTTVTKLKRRIFTFSETQCRHAMFHVKPTKVFLNFANYCTPDRLQEITGIIGQCAHDEQCGGVYYIGNGPSSKDVTYPCGAPVL